MGGFHSPRLPVVVLLYDLIAKILVILVFRFLQAFSPCPFVVSDRDGGD